MNSNIVSIGKKVATVALLGFTALSPIFFLPTSADFFDWNKIALSFVVATLLLILWTVISIARKTLRITLSPMLAPVLLFTVSMVISSIVVSSNKVEAFTGVTLLVSSMAVIFIAGSHLLKMKSYEAPMLALGISGTLLTIVSLLQVAGVGPSLLLNNVLGVQLPNNILFNLAGNPLAALTFLLPVFLGTITTVFSVKEMEKKATYAVISGVLLAGLLLNGFFMLPGKVAELSVLPPSISWSIALETLKTPITAFFGVGPESYVNAFTQFRPPYYNLLAQWSSRYSLATNVPLHILTSVGVVGFFAYIFLVIKSVRMSLPLKKETKPFSVMVLTILALQLVLPFNMVQIILLFLSLMFMMIIMKSHGDERVTDVMMHLFAVKLVDPDKEKKTGPENASAVLAYVLAFFVVLGAGYSVFFVGKAYAANFLFYQSLVAAQKNDGLKTYTLQGRAVQINPYNMQLRRSFATTNYALAKSLSEKENPTDQDKNDISTLVQQAIAEAKASVALDTKMTANWETLSFVYKNLIGTAQGADEWAIASYVQAIQTDPVNPALRMDLGGVYLSTQQLDNAIQLFQQTINLKPDWANAYYNLGYAYMQKKDEQSAYQAFSQALQLLDPNSQDKAMLEKQVETLKKSLEDQAKKAQTNAQKQSETQANGTQQVPDGQIRIPENLGLPEAQPPANVPTPQPTSNPIVVPESSPASQQ